MACDKAKLLAGGTLMCPCHGIHRKAARLPRPRAPKPLGRPYGPRPETVAARNKRDGDEMAAALVAVLKRIRAQLPQSTYTKGSII